MKSTLRQQDTEIAGQKMETQTISNRLLEMYSSISRASRAGIVAMLVVVSAVLVQTSQRPQQTCQLIDNCKLSDSDLQQIQIVLGRAGLSEFTISDQSISVPKSKRKEYLKALADADRLPRQLQTQDDSTQKINPFMSRTQQQMVARSEKKRQIQEMVRRLRFVEEAWFEMDATNPRSAFEASKHSAVISIQPVGTQSLNQQDLDTVRRIVTGAIASISADQIVVTDLNAGRAYQNTSTDPGPGRNMMASFTKSDDRKQFFEDEIRRALSDYHGLEIKVHYHAEGVPESASMEGLLPNTNRSLESNNELENDAVAMTIGTNSKASVVDEIPSVEDSPAVARVSSGVDQRTTSKIVERIGVSVVVPHAVLANRNTRLATIGTRASPTSSEQFEKVKSDIIEKVRPILPMTSFNQPATYPISVVLEQQPAMAVATVASQWQQRISQYWPTIGAVVIGLILLRLVTRSEKAESNQQPATLSLHSAVADSQEVTQKNATQQQLSRLIDADPDTAAKVLKSWIRDAA